jgi:hypothetical protein
MDSTPTPIVCDMTTATDTPAERVEEYASLFDAALVGREHTPRGIRFRFDGSPAIEARVRDLAAREQVCCAFFTFTITRHDGEIWWDAEVPHDDTAVQILEELFRLPDTVHAGVADVRERFEQRGLRFAGEERC